MNNLKLWDKSFYYIYEFSSTMVETDKFMSDIFKKYPPLLYGTHVVEKHVDTKRDRCRLTMKHFKSMEECVRHCTAPTLGWIEAV